MLAGSQFSQLVKAALIVHERRIEAPGLSDGRIGSRRVGDEGAVGGGEEVPVGAVGGHGELDAADGDAEEGADSWLILW